VQNLEKNVNSTILTDNSFWRTYDIMDDEERKLIIRFYKRFYYKTIEKKYGYLKSHATDKAEISGRILCTELELNPKVLSCFDVITTYNYGGDAMVSWIPFIKIIAIFVLKKEAFEMRIDFLFKFLNVTSSTIFEENPDDPNNLANNNCRVMQEL
jgi:hypothetical protein